MGMKGNSLRSNNLHPDPIFPAVLAALEGDIVGAKFSNSGSFL